MLTRSCTSEEGYAVPGFPKLKVAKDQDIVIPAAGIQMDPEFYPEPEKFIPERFSKEEKANRLNYINQSMAKMF